MAESIGLIKISASGAGLNSINLSIESMINHSLEITIAPGTMFQANFGHTQDMVVRKSQTVTLETRGTKKTLIIAAACANMHKNTPTGGDRFTISRTPGSEDLRKLLNLPEFNQQDFNLQQFAIWTITDNPHHDGYVSIGTFESGVGPTPSALQTIKTLFQKAGIDTQKYRALQ